MPSEINSYYIYLILLLTRTPLKSWFPYHNATLSEWTHTIRCNSPCGQRSDGPSQWSLNYRETQQKRYRFYSEIPQILTDYSYCMRILQFLLKHSSFSKVNRWKSSYWIFERHAFPVVVPDLAIKATYSFMLLKKTLKSSLTVVTLQLQSSHLRQAVTISNQTSYKHFIIICFISVIVVYSTLPSNTLLTLRTLFAHKCALTFTFVHVLILFVCIL